MNLEGLKSTTTTTTTTITTTIWSYCEIITILYFDLGTVRLTFAQRRLKPWFVSGTGETLNVLLTLEILGLQIAQLALVEFRKVSFVCEYQIKNDWINKQNKTILHSWLNALLIL